MHFSKNTKDDILQTARLSEVIDDFYPLTGNQTAKNKYTKCPFCGKEGKGKGLSVNITKQVAKCFSCDWSTKSPVNFLMEAEQKTYPEALEWLADKYNIIEPEPANKKPKMKKTFCSKQLAESGLTQNDIVVNEKQPDGTVKQVQVFQAKTKDKYGNITEGDDMLIWYHDLNYQKILYKKPKGNKMLPFYRFRWQHPTDPKHLDKNGNPKKYESPYGAGVEVFIPEPVRNMYNEGRQFARLYLQEGEKKAVKATKHGMPSIGIGGINMLGRDNRLPDAVRYIIEHCGVKEVVFVFDSDYKALSDDLKINERVDKRPFSFYSAAKNFKDYMKTLKNINIYVDVFLAAIQSSEDKGIDDLLTNTLKGSENTARESIDHAINEKTGKSDYFQVYQITEFSDSKLKEIWSLDSATNFAEAYRERLKALPEFIIHNHRWRFNENGQFESAQPIEEYEKYWEIEYKQNKQGDITGETYHFDYENCYNFLNNRGFCRIPMQSGEYGAKHRRFEFARVDNKVAKLIDPHEIKDFVMEFTKEVAPKPIRNMMYRGGKMYLGPDSLSNIDWFFPTFNRAGKDFMYMLFKSKTWRISAENIEIKDYNDLKDFVWHDEIKMLEPSFRPDLFKIEKITQEYIDSHAENDRELLQAHLNEFRVHLTDEGKKSHWLQFLWNTSDFFWQDYKELTYNKSKRSYEMKPRFDETGQPKTLGFEQQHELEMHFLSKVTALGYLMHAYFDSSTAKAIIGMDGKMSEVGQSNGGSGKSLFGDSLQYLVPTTSIPAKSKKLTDDPFLFEEVDEKTQVVFLDDVRANMDFEFLFPFITGKFMVNAKGEKKFTLPMPKTPKFYIPTNHAINGDGTSYKRRQFHVAFSDYYNDKHTPIDDFGTNFFTEWDNEQWSLFYSFAGYCLKTYIKYGLISGPKSRLTKRKLRQEISETFLMWADAYFRYDEATGKFQSFAEGNQNINMEISRQELYSDLLEKHPESRKYITATNFKRRMKKYCEFREVTFNPTRISRPEQIHGDDIKKGGQEYFMIATKDFINSLNNQNSVPDDGMPF